MKKSGSFRVVVNWNTVILVALALMFFGVGYLRATSWNSDGLMSACAEDFDNMTRAECEHHYGTMDFLGETVMLSDALFFYSIGFLVLVGAFIYRSHASARDLK